MYACTHACNNAYMHASAAVSNQFLVVFCRVRLAAVLLRIGNVVRCVGFDLCRRGGVGGHSERALPGAWICC